MKRLKKFETIAAYNAATLDLPNVSLIKENMSVSYNPSSPEPPSDPRLIVVYNVTDTANETNILEEYYAPALFSSMEVDGNEPQSVTSGYTFSTTGEHTIKYTPIDAEHMESEYGVFYKLTAVLSVAIPSTFKSIPQALLDGCGSVTSVTMPNSVETINRLAFRNCTSLTELTLSDNLISIGDEAFNFCRSLTSISIPNSVREIGYRSFRTCSGLTSIVIPSNVTSIGRDAFDRCSGLTSVTVEATTPPTLGNWAFDGNASGRKIYVPSTSVDAYKAASGWSAYAADILSIQ